MEYKVKLIFLYSDVVHVTADTEEEAEVLAIKDCKEEFECFYDSEIKEVE